MRIITGSVRGAKLIAPEGEHTRPTSERAKEALFSSLAYKTQGARVLDLFAGSGQLGLEAVSRGAASAVLVDNDINAVNTVSANIKKCRLEDKCEIKRSDSLAYLKIAPKRAKFDLVLLDPPYATDLVERAVEELLRNDLLSDDALIVCESDRESILSGESAERLERVKIMKHGVAIIQIFRLKESDK